MADNQIRVDIVANNAATPEIARVRGDLETLEGSLRKVAVETRNVSDAADQTRGLGRHLTALASISAGQLNPALGQTGAFMSIIAREGQSVSLGMTAFSVSAAVAVGALVELNKMLTEAATRHAELAHVVAVNDFPGAMGAATKAVTALRVQTELLDAEPLRRFFGTLSDWLAGKGLTSGGFLENIFSMKQQERALAEAQASVQRIQTSEVKVRAAESTEQYSRAELALARTLTQEAEKQQDLAAAYRQTAAAATALQAAQRAGRTVMGAEHETETRKLLEVWKGGPLPDDVRRSLEYAQNLDRKTAAIKESTQAQALELTNEAALKGIQEAKLGLQIALTAAQVQYIQARETEATLHASDAERFVNLEAYLAAHAALTQQINTEIDLTEKQIHQEAALARMRTAGPGGAPGAAWPAITALEGARIETEEQKRDARLQQLQSATQRTAITLRDRLLAAQAPGVGQELDEYGQPLSEAMNIGRTAAQNIANTKKKEAQELEAARLSLQSQRLDLTRQERVELALQTIEQEHQRALAEAKGKMDQDHLVAMAEQTAAMKTALELQKAAAAADPLRGLSLGLQDVTDSYLAMGTVLRDNIKTLGSDLSRTFSETFTSVVTGDFKKLNDLPKAFAKSIIDAIGDVLAKQVIGTFFGRLSQAFGGSGTGVFSGLGLGLGGGGGGGGSLVSVGGQLYQTVAAGGGQTVLVPVSGSGGASSGFGLGNLPIPGGAGQGLLSGTSLGTWLNTPLSTLFSSEAVVSGGQLISNAGELAMTGGEAAGIAGESAGMLGATTVASAAGGIAGGLGLGYTLYNALTQPQTTQSVVVNTASGAVGGAALGSAIAAGAGIGAGFFGVGAIVGAVAGALVAGGASMYGKSQTGGKQTTAQKTAAAAAAGASNLSAAITAATTLDALRDILNTQWSPYDEVVIVSYDTPTHWSSVASTTTGGLPVPAGYTNGTPGSIIAYPSNGLPYPDVQTMLQDSRYVDNLDIQVGSGGSASYDSGLTGAFQSRWAALAGPLGQVEFGYSETLTGAGITGSVTRSTILPLSALSSITAGSKDLSVFQETLLSLDATTRAAFLQQLAQADRDQSLNIIYQDGPADAITVGTYTVT